MDSHTLAEFTHRIAGEVVVPNSPAYDDLRNVFNRAGSPAVIVRGHGLSGLATNNGGLVLDLTPFNQVKMLDAERSLVRIGAGARWGEVAKALAAHSLAISSGDTNQVGVGGLTLGGGIGWMVRTHGLTIDSLQAAEIITADGRMLRVSANAHPDLFWAIRGGGGNFGVVTSFDFRAQACKAIVGGSVVYDAAEVETVLPGWANAMREAPEELNSTIVLFSGFGPQMPPQVMVLLCYAGDDEAAANLAMKPFLHLGTVKGQTIQKKPYYAILEDAVAPPPTLKLANHDGFLKTLTSETLAVMAAHYGKSGTPILQVRSLGGAMARVSPQATAFAHREHEALAVMAAFVPANVPEEQAHAMRRAAWHPMEPYSSGAYLNFLSDASEASVAEVYPSATYARLASIKATYDPDNVFNQNQNIKPVANPQA
jgi:FAD/FMN-containing dehydrogenase